MGSVKSLTLIERQNLHARAQRDTKTKKQKLNLVPQDFLLQLNFSSGY